MAYFAIKSIKKQSTCNYRYAVVKILLSILTTVDYEVEYNSTLTNSTFQSVQCVCPPPVRHRLLDAMSLCILSRNYPSNEKHFVVKKMNTFFESLSAEHRYGESVKNDKNSLLPPFPGQASPMPMGFTKATRVLYNLATNAFGVVVENQPAVRFYCAKTIQLKRVVSPAETDENLDEVLWSENGLYFAATIGNALNLWPLFEAHPKDESLEDEISREGQFFQIKFSSKISAMATDDTI